MDTGGRQQEANKNPLLLRWQGGGKSYFTKTPRWMKMIYPRRIWQIDTKEKIIYLSFDDGPHPVATPFVLDLLKQYDAHATFFCIGKNAARYPELYKRIQEEGHAAGNHTQHHLNGWKTDTETYLADVKDATTYIHSSLFRPPYGRLTGKQAKGIGRALGKPQARIIMWDVLSGDFDRSLDKEKCLEGVLTHTGPGSIVVFHDSEKALPLLSYVLPLVLENFSRLGYRFNHLAL